MHVELASAIGEGGHSEASDGRGTVHNGKEPECLKRLVAGGFHFYRYTRSITRTESRNCCPLLPVSNYIQLRKCFLRRTSSRLKKIG